eukprot:2581557-Pyramimonas_sp.AAC.1
MESNSAVALGISNKTKCKQPLREKRYASDVSVMAREKRCVGCVVDGVGKNLQRNASTCVPRD